MTNATGSAGAWLIGCVVLGTAACAMDEPAIVECRPGTEPIELRGSVAEADARGYRLLPFDVAPGTGRIEVGYAWQAHTPADDPLEQTTLDLGLRDAAGPFAPAGFRGWSGSRQGRMDLGQQPVFIEADTAERGYLPGAIEPGRWHVELGIAAVTPGGAGYTVSIACHEAEAAEAFVADPVAATHVARDESAWYHGDFHVHGHHSHPDAPAGDALLDQARAGGLDFLMLTEYVTTAHWRTLGALQRAHPDLILWPGREVISYFGHATVFGETPGVNEYRHGFEGISMADVQAASVDAGALFGIAHPTIFPGERYRRYCRGCEYELDSHTDFDRVATIEVLTGPIIVDSSMLELPGPARPMQNPFVDTAIAYWEDKLRRGHRITAVSGSDAKGVEPEAQRALRGLGSSATAVFAESLSRPALRTAIESGRAYVRTRGVAASPALLMEAVTDDDARYGLGDAVPADRAMLRVAIDGAEGQTLEIIRNGELVREVTVDSDPFIHEQRIGRADDEGPLGTFWRVQTRDAVALTTIGNPIFLTGRSGRSRAQP